jgi:hypothetical protein
MKVYMIQIQQYYSSNDCVVANSMAEAETAFQKVYPQCEIRAITQLYDKVIIVPLGIPCIPSNKDEEGKNE